MENKGRLVFGGGLILLGVILLIGILTNIDIWTFFWPAFLIGLGLWLIFRPSFSKERGGLIFRPLADIKRNGEWVVEDQEIWLFVGDVDLDLTRAILPPGETKIQIFGFVGEVNLLVPEDAGVTVTSNAFVTDAKVLGEEVDNIFVPYSWSSRDYIASERKLAMETNMFVASIKVDQLQASS